MLFKGTYTTYVKNLKRPNKKDKPLVSVNYVNKISLYFNTYDNCFFL